MNKINVWPIVKDHFSTLRNLRTKHVSYADFAFFLGLPAVITWLLITGDVSLPERTTGLLATGLSIFAGLLFNLLLLVADIAARGDKDQPVGKDRFRARIKMTVLRELHSNIAFGVLLSLANLGLVICLSINGDLPGRRVAEGALFYLGFLFVLTLLMILRRAHALIAHEVLEAERAAAPAEVTSSKSA